MAIALRILDSADLARSKANAHPEVQQDIPCEEGKKVQYRQLVSRAVTQRLHSSSLEDLTKTTVDTTPAHTLEEWELQERCIARNKARVEAEMLGIPWSTIDSPSLLHTLLPSYRVFYACTRTDSQEAQFVHDVESAALQVHVLRPTRYEEPPRSTNKNQDASKANSGLLYKFGDSEKSERDRGRKMRDANIYDMLRAFGSARSGS
jgi:hypothetical protein